MYVVYKTRTFSKSYYYTYEKIRQHNIKPPISFFHFGDVAEPGARNDSLILGLELGVELAPAGGDVASADPRLAALSNADTGGLVASGDGTAGYEKEFPRNADGGTAGGGIMLPPAG